MVFSRDPGKQTGILIGSLGLPSDPATQAQRHRRTSATIQQGPLSWPIIRNLLQLRSNPNIKLNTLARTYGPIVSIMLDAKLMVVGSSPKAASKILKTHDTILSTRHLSYTHPASSSKLNKFAIGFTK
ncbi:hypothetical protein RD792_013051 [Penstemon davidsonii]|uniref:Cytochrome P450 n=1 Tax=Penstemon davidsonii TaxID=160366 RepID=A0ABR0CTD0_9LAMI|nr:hypothetical protein RD792_013051 [Penstemon davidsonii]